MKAQAYIRSMRLEQWVKNLLICFPAFFGQAIDNNDIWLKLSWAIVGFSFITSGIYFINDIADRKTDSKHPVKRLKPIAIGEIKQSNAILFATLLILLGGSLIAIQIGLYFLLFPLLYILINLSYSFFLKQVPILDILCVSSGFLIRVFFGAQLSQNPVSLWLTLLILLMSIYLLLSKRRNRKFVKGLENDFYAQKSFDGIIVLMGIITFVAYFSYTISPSITEMFKTSFLWITSIPALAGILRFTSRVLKTNTYFEPVKFILTDPLMIISILIWAISLISIIYV